MDFTREGLAAEGFAGFVTWNDLSWGEVPPSPGVYVVINDGPHPPEFLSLNPAGWFKERDPTASRTTLAAAWVEGCTIVYIGKAARLRTRLRQYRNHGQGKPVGHWGGRYIWQLAAAANYAPPGKSPVRIRGYLSKRCSPPSSNATANCHSRT